MKIKQLLFLVTVMTNSCLTKVNSVCINNDFNLLMCSSVPSPTTPIDILIRTVKFTGVEIPVLVQNHFTNFGNVMSLVFSKCNITMMQQKCFKNLKKLQHLTFNCNDIYELDGDSFTGLNNLVVLNLEQNRIEKVNKFSFNDLVNLETLDLGRNQIEKIPEYTFLLPQLLDLILSDNLITKISDNTFIGLHNLQNLFLSDNAIRHMSENAFAMFETITFIDLNNNKITHLQQTLFAKTANLSKLQISNNLITVVSRATFKNCANLKFLDLSENFISEIKDDAFEGNAGLEFLHLEFNRIKALSKNSLRGLHNLKYLYLYKNNITHIAPYGFHDLSSLKLLNLAHNNIKHVSRYLFDSLVSLNELVLTGNAILFTPNTPGAFLKMAALEELYISRHNLTKLDVITLFEKIPHLEKLYCVENIWSETWSNEICEINDNTGDGDIVRERQREEYDEQRRDLISDGSLLYANIVSESYFLSGWGDKGYVVLLFVAVTVIGCSLLVATSVVIIRKMSKSRMSWDVQQDLTFGDVAVDDIQYTNYYGDRLSRDLYQPEMSSLNAFRIWSSLPLDLMCTSSDEEVEGEGPSFDHRTKKFRYREDSTL